MPPRPKGGGEGGGEGNGALRGGAQTAKYSLNLTTISLLGKFLIPVDVTITKNLVAISRSHVQVPHKNLFEATIFARFVLYKSPAMVLFDSGVPQIVLMRPDEYL